jgi:hypothetical protein
MPKLMELMLFFWKELIFDRRWIDIFSIRSIKIFRVLSLNLIFGFRFNIFSFFEIK